MQGVQETESCLCNGDGQMTDEVIRLREEVSEQIRALQDMKKMAASYGYDISYPATNAREAIQWLYFGYLASIAMIRPRPYESGNPVTILLWRARLISSLYASKTPWLCVLCKSVKIRSVSGSISIP